MKWDSFLISFFLPLILGLGSVWTMLYKMRGENKKMRLENKKLNIENEKLSSHINIESFTALIASNTQLREDLMSERTGMKQELEAEKSTVRELASRVIYLTTKLEHLQKVLKNMLGVKNINIKNIKISVLEDNPDEIELLKNLLTNNGIENVEYYRDADTFIEKVDSTVRILIIDHKLERGMTGLDVIKKIIDRDEYRYFIMLSGMDDFNVLYAFLKMVHTGIYILKHRDDTNDMLVRSIRNTVRYMNLLSETYEEFYNKKE